MVQGEIFVHITQTLTQNTKWTKKDICLVYFSNFCERNATQIKFMLLLQSNSVILN